MSLSKKLASATGIILFFICLFPFWKNIAADPGIPSVYTQENLPNIVCPVCPPDPVCPDPCQNCVDCPAGQVDIGNGCEISNQLPSTGLHSTGLHSTGLPSTGLPSTGLPSTGLPSTGLPSTPPPTPTPTPLPDPKVCDLYQFDFKFTKSKQRKSVTGILDQTNAKGLECFTNIYKGIISGHNPSTKTQHHGGGVSAILWSNLLANSDLTAGPPNYESNKKLIDCTGKYRSPRPDGHNATAMIGGGQVGGDKGRRTPGCSQGRLFLNQNCELQPISKVRNETNEICGNINLLSEVSTPISLIWTDDYTNAPSTMVNFKLNPYSDAEVWLWRASEALPLLVYDPEHSGVITSASQLFGNWTFGGNGLASLVTNSGENTPWRDGYQALQSLDMNNDGKISESELDDLALWFDYNKDGISQPGEVISLSRLSVTTLFYKADKEEKGAKVATLGFERFVNGKTITGSSMDWSEKSMHDGLGIYIDEHALSRTNESVVPDSSVDATISSGFAKKNSEALAGLWVYTVDSPMKGSGYLAFDLTEDGLMGTSLLPVKVEGSSAVQNQLLFSHFEVLFAEEDTARFGYKASNGADLQNTVSIADDGSLKGKTIVTNSQVSQSGSYEYTWTALKVVMK
jgi:hypothetical protein